MNHKCDLIILVMDTNRKSQARDFQNAIMILPPDSCVFYFAVDQEARCVLEHVVDISRLPEGMIPTLIKYVRETTPMLNIAAIFNLFAAMIEIDPPIADTIFCSSFTQHFFDLQKYLTEHTDFAQHAITASICRLLCLATRLNFCNVSENPFANTFYMQCVANQESGFIDFDGFSTFAQKDQDTEKAPIGELNLQAYFEE